MSVHQHSATAASTAVTLVIDSSSDHLVTGLVTTSSVGTQNPQVIASETITTRDHYAALVPMIQRLQAAHSAPIDQVIAGTGPGPFTGLRVGIATAVAWADALGVPCLSACSLDAAATAQAQPGQTQLVALNARRREVYWALYQSGQRLTELAVTAPAALAQEITQPVHQVVWPSDVPVPEWLAQHENLVQPAPAVTVAGLAQVAVAGPVIPLYLRRPDAKEPAAQPKSPAVPDVHLA